MLHESYELFRGAFPKLHRILNKQWYEYISALDRDGMMRFMNYGYADSQINRKTLPLKPADEPYRYFIQLYHHVAGAIDLTGLDVLEVGCGVGAGRRTLRAT